MSTALIDSGRFGTIHRSLRHYATDGIEQSSCSMESSNIAHALGVNRPFGEVGIEEARNKVASLVFDLQRLNHAAYVARYEDAKSEPAPNPAKPTGKILNQCALLKALRCIQYNSDGGKVASESLLASLTVLDQVIDALAENIIGALPDYAEADWF